MKKGCLNCTLATGHTKDGNMFGNAIHVADRNKEEETSKLLTGL